jgi:peptidoglycan/LPS O-acetylase OafA/YrhL
VVTEEQRRPGPSARSSATGNDRIAALDGLRAFSLLIIMGYHFGVARFQGGFFSLDIFYVLSGYLITGLLLGEWARAARIRLGAFWARRARRLLPALLVVVVVVTLVVRFADAPGIYPNMRMADLSALFYFSNWWQIASSGNYFAATGAVSPLTHTWSLAVEEQFYLVWPFVVLAALYVGKRFDRGIEVLLGVSLVGVVASAGEMAYLYRSGSSITRLYFGTDTHAQSLMVGSVLACTLTLVQRHRGLTGMAPSASSRVGRSLLTLLGLAGAAGTLLLTTTLSGVSAVAYQGGFLLSALSAAALITGAGCVVGGPIARALAVRPMVWMGTVSYGAYLWHYPVLIELDSSRTGLTGLALLTARVVATFALAGLSYYLVERPVMDGTFWRSVRSAVPAVGAVGATVAVVVTFGSSVAVAGLPSVRAAVDQSGRTPGSDLVLVVGDSTALTLGFALNDWAEDSHDGLQIVDNAWVGCGVADGPYLIAGGVQVAVQSQCNTTTPTDQQWPASLAADLRLDHPKVVVFLAGRWEVYDRVEADGQVTSIENPSYADYVRRQIQLVDTMATAAGSRVVLLTAPYYQPGELPDGQPLPEDEPGRVRLYNRLVAEVAASNARTTALVDLNAIVDPDGRFTSSVHGLVIRAPDGVHFPYFDIVEPDVASPDTSAQVDRFGRWLGPKVLPTIAAQVALDEKSGSA